MNTPATTTAPREIDLAQVATVYSGRPGCCCGCRGKHTAASAHRAWAAKNRGYDFDDDEVSDRQVRRVARIMNEHAGQLEWSGNHAFYDAGTRWYIAYFVREAE